MKYKHKYLKYKSKYLSLKKKYGGLQKDNENLELPESPPQSPPQSPIDVISSFVQDFFNFTGISLMGLLGNPTITSETHTSEPPTLEPPTLEPPTPPDSDDETPISLAQLEQQLEYEENAGYVSSDEDDN